MSVFLDTKKVQTLSQRPQCYKNTLPSFPRKRESMFKGVTDTNLATED